jgi:sugar phosphate isomerase/epimerase
MLSTRIGLAGHAFRHHSPDELLAFVRRLGAVGLDYWPWNKGELSVEQFRQLADEYAVEVYCVNVPGAVARVTDPAADERWVDRILAAMDDAVVLGATMVQVYCGVPVASDIDESAAALVESVRSLVDEARRRGLVLTVENNLDQRGEDARRLNPSRTPEAIRRAVHNLDDPHFRVCYDPCNFVTAGVEEYPLAYDLLVGTLVNVHVKDCRRYAAELHSGDPSATKLLVDSQEGPFLPSPLGAGAVAWREIVDRLDRDGYLGWVTLDPFIADKLLESWCLDAAHWLCERVVISPALGSR